MLLPCPGDDMLVPHRVPAAAATETVKVVARAAVEHVIARTAVQNVVAVIADENITAVAAYEDVVAVAARHNIVAVAAIQAVVARTAQVSMAARRHGACICRRHRGDQVHDRPAGRDVVGRHQLPQVQPRAVPERDGLDLREVVRPVLDRHPVRKVVERRVRVVRVLQRDLEAAGGQAKQDVADADVAMQIQHVGGPGLQHFIGCPGRIGVCGVGYAPRSPVTAFPTPIVVDPFGPVGRIGPRLFLPCPGDDIFVAYRVMTVAATETVEVVPGPALERVVARAAPKHIVARAAFQRVVARAAAEPVRQAVAGQAVVVGRAEDIFAVGDGVPRGVTAAGRTVDGHGYRGAGTGIAYRVVAGAAVQRVGVPFALQVVVAGVAVEDVSGPPPPYNLSLPSPP